MKSIFLFSILIWFAAACTSSEPAQYKAARKLHKDRTNQMSAALVEEPTSSPEASSSPTPLPPLPSPLPEVSCNDLLNEATDLYENAADVCQACNELWQVCENCINNPGTINDPLTADLCLASCQAEANCYGDTLSNYTHPLRDLNAQYIDNNCLQPPAEKTIGNIPVYDACIQPSPTPTERAPPPTP